MHLLTQNKGICDKETSLWHKQDQLQNNLIGLDIPQALEKEAFFSFLLSISNCIMCIDVYLKSVVLLVTGPNPNDDGLLDPLLANTIPEPLVSEPIKV